MGLIFCATSSASRFDLWTSTQPIPLDSPHSEREAAGMLIFSLFLAESSLSAAKFRKPGMNACLDVSRQG